MVVLSKSCLFLFLFLCSIACASHFALFGGSFVRDFYLWKFNTNNQNDCQDNYKEELQNSIRELQRETIKLRDERTAWRKQNYVEGRIESNLNLLEENLKNIGRLTFPNQNNTVLLTSDNEMLVCLSIEIRSNVV